MELIDVMTADTFLEVWVKSKKVEVPHALILRLTTVKIVTVVLTLSIEYAALSNFVMVKEKADAEIVVEG